MKNIKQGLLALVMFYSSQSVAYVGELKWQYRAIINEYLRY